MKYKSYGNSVDEYEDGLGTEFTVSNDSISARTINRPINNLYENQEEIYNLLQTLSKTVYGNYSGIIPDVLEEFYDKFSSVGSYKNNINNYYLRIPLGFLFGRIKEDSEDGSNNGNPFSKKGEFDYKDKLNKSNFTQDDWHSYVVNNQPNIGLYERQLANLIQLDLSDLSNDIKVYYDMIPAAKRIPVLDEETGFQKYDSFGNPEYEMEEDSVTYKYERDEEGNIVYEKDENGNIRHRIGYYINVVRSTSGEDEITWLPNKSENSSWKFVLEEINSNVEGQEYLHHTYNITVFDNNKTIENFQFSIKGNASSETINQLLFTEVNTNCKTLQAEMFTTTIGEEIKSGVKLICKSTSSKETNNYKITIRLDDGFAYDLMGNNNGARIESIPATSKTEQRYYDNIFQTTNAFVNYFNSYLTKTETLNNYVSLEPTVAILNDDKLNVLVYDTEADSNNKLKESYDKTGKYKLVTTPFDISYVLDGEGRISDYKINNKKLSELDINSILNSSPEYNRETMFPLIAYVFKKENKVPNRIEILDSLPVYDIMDRRLISTKRAELNTLESNTRTDLINYINIRDSINNPSRSFEITEDHEESSNNQTRITSPIVRITDVKNDKTGNTNPQTNSWSDSKKGDTPSDFFEESTPVKNLETGNISYTYHNDFTNQGLIIDTNKGVKLFSNTPNKPLDISASKGNINIYTFNVNNDGTENLDYKTNRINIRNTHDYDTNMVDILGITRIRSKNNGQLVIRKIGDLNTSSESSILFTIGNSKANASNKALTGSAEGDTYVGNIAFNGDSSNRFFHLRLSESNSSTPLETLTIRNGTTSDGNNHVKKIFKLYGSQNPSYDEIYNLGSGKNSRFYTNTTDDSIDSEGRWLNSFIKNGYFGSIYLADRSTDVSNDDSLTKGALNLGNSNIYNVSSIYINRDTTTRKNLSTINFANSTANKMNTIFSNNTSGISFVLSRAENSAPSTNTNTESNTNGALVYMKPQGTEIRKKLWVKRQAFINCHSDSSTEDNSALVVKGQSVLNGELVVDKSASSISNAENSSGVPTPNKADDYKRYNEEFSPIENGSKVNSADSLYMFRVNGRSYLSGDITLDENSKFTENATFNKALIIKNKNYNNFDYNSVNKTVCLPTNDKYIDSIITDNYFISDNRLPRNNTALSVESGKVVFGKDSDNANIDTSDLMLYGTQWIKRRLSIGSVNLINTSMATGSLLENENESPSFYINGASQFSGDVVFGHLATNNDNSYLLAKSKATASDANYLPIKAIFWGKNKAASGSNLYTDFDFHGKTWLDGNVYIGDNSGNANGNGTAKLIIYGADNTESLTLNGALKATKAGDSTIAGNSFKITATNNVLDLSKTTVSLTSRNQITIKSQDSGATNASSIELTNTTGKIGINEGGSKSEINLNKNLAKLSNKDGYIDIETNTDNTTHGVNIFNTDTSKIELKDEAIIATIGDNTIIASTKEGDPAEDKSSIKIKSGENTFVNVLGTEKKIDISANNGITLGTSSNGLQINTKSKLGSSDSYLEIDSSIIKLRTLQNGSIKIGGSASNSLISDITLENAKNINLTYNTAVNFNNKASVDKNGNVSAVSLKIGNYGISNAGVGTLSSLSIGNYGISNAGVGTLSSLSVGNINSTGDIIARKLDVQDTLANNASADTVNTVDADISGKIEANTINITGSLTAKNIDGGTVNANDLVLDGVIKNTTLYGDTATLSQTGTIQENSVINLTTNAQGLRNDATGAGQITSSGAIKGSTIYGSTLTSSGTGAKIENSDVTVSGAITNNGTISGGTVSGTSLSNSGTAKITSNVDITGTITNNGTISGSVGSASLDNKSSITGATTITGAITNNGTISGKVSSASLDNKNSITGDTSVTGAITNNGTIESESVSANSLTNNQNAIINVVGTEEIEGVIETKTLSNSGTIEAAEVSANSITNNSSGYIGTSENPTDIIITGAITNSGTINGGTIEGATSITNSGTISNASISVSGGITGGSISGGSVSGDTLDVSGSITSATTTIANEIKAKGVSGGNVSGDTLDVSGSITNASAITIGGNIKANSVSMTSADKTISGGSLEVTNNLEVKGTLKSDGDITAGSATVQNVSGGNVEITGAISITTMSGGSATTSGDDKDISIATLSGTGSVSGTGAIDITTMSSGSATTTGTDKGISIGSVSGGSVSGTGAISINGAVSGGSVTTSGTNKNISIGSVSDGTITGTGEININGEVSGGTIKTTGTSKNITIGSVSDGTISGSGAISITGAMSGGSASGTSVTIGSMSDGTISGSGAISITGAMSGGSVSGTGVTINTLSGSGKIEGENVEITNGMSGGTIEASGDITVSSATGGSFSGTNVDISNLSGSNSEITASGDITVGAMSNGSVSTTGSITIDSTSGGNISGTNIVLNGYILRIV